MKKTQGLVLALAAGGFAMVASAHPMPNLMKHKPYTPSLDQANNNPVTDLFPFSDNFDSYSAGSTIAAAGAGNGWTPWPGAPASAFVASGNSTSGPNAISTVATSDDVQTSTAGQITSGKWKLSAKCYMPSSALGSGGAFIIGLNTFQTVSGPNNWSCQLGFDTDFGAGQIGHVDGAGTLAPGAISITPDKWLDVVISIDLDADTFTATVDGTPVIDPPVSWSQGASGGGVTAIECWDFYSSGANGFLYDDVKFEADGASACYADCDGGGSLNIDDFICFQTFFALGDPFADCDGGGSLNIDDFICFQTFFALGC
jgi:hypothetical protein